MPDAKATLPAAIVSYIIPENGHADFPALALLGTILGEGESSRLNRVLAREKKAVVASQALAGLSFQRLPSVQVEREAGVRLRRRLRDGAPRARGSDSHLPRSRLALSEITSRVCELP